MAAKEPGIVMGGWRLLWRRQSILWWVYAVNLILAGFATLPVVLRLSSVLNSSLAAHRLYHGFDLPTFLELASHPDVALAAQVPGSVLFAVVFFVFMLFLTGGILASYRQEQKPSRGEFFRACGAFFWRFVRLLIFMAIIVGLILLVGNRVRHWSNTLAAESAIERLGFWVELSGSLVVLFVLMCVRLWFDMAQVRAVAEDEHKMRRTMLTAFKFTVGNFGTLFWMYLRISLVAWAGSLVVFWVWLRFVRPEWVWLSFLLQQVVILLWLGTRLWLRASETLWYRRMYPVSAAASEAPTIPREAPAAPPASAS